MNWIAGICNLDGEPVQARLLEKLFVPVCANVADGVNCWVDGSIGVGAYAPSSTGMSPSNSFPAYADSRVCIVFDGRLDNRDDLLEQVRLRPDEADGMVTCKVLAAAYELWGTDCLGKLIGDFAFSLWDKTHRRLVCARDIFGVRSLFYWLDGRSLIWATSIRQLLALRQIQRTIDLEYVANYLVRQELPLVLTPYREIKRLEPAHSLVIESGRISLNRYWSPNARNEISYKSDHQYAEHFLQLFRGAVRARLESAGPVWCELSGGLDSSSIACVAYDLVNRGQSSVKELATLSWIYDKAYYSDERTWIQAVVRKCGATAHFICCDECYPLEDLFRSPFRWDEPSFVIIFGSLMKRVRDMLYGAGVNVILSGIGGDQTGVPGSCPVYLADLFKRLRLVRVIRDLIQWQREMQLPLATLFGNSCVRPLLHPNRYRFQAELDSIRQPVPPWIKESFAQSWHIGERALCRLVSPSYRSTAYQSRCERILEVGEKLWRGEIESVCEHRYPFLDRRLVEFCLAVPWTRLFAPGQPKSLLRHAMSRYLPEQIQTRAGGKGPDHAIYLALAKEWPRIEPRLRNPRLAEIGVIDSRAFLKALGLARAGYAVSIGKITATLSLEHWLVSEGM
jgi:asparagine synthase (glutamine-hydrolysing)